jgi:hypothetical protein
LIAECGAGWDEAEFFEDVETDTQGFGMYNHQAIIVSFRGTVGKQNWLTNLDYCPVPQPNVDFASPPVAHRTIRHAT